MATITIEVPDDIAERYQRASDEEKRQLQLKLAFLLELERKQRITRLFESMRELSEEAKANGLTPEILEQLLNEQ